MKVLVAGWFSFEQMGASAGDLLCCELVMNWLTTRGIEVLVAYAPPFKGGVNWQEVPPESLDAVTFVCGPFGNGWPIPDFLQRFQGIRLVGVNLTMLQNLKEWNPFDALFERDSSRTCRPDVVFLSPPTRVPVVGLVLVHPQQEYGASGRHGDANEALRQLARSQRAATVSIDTRLDINEFDMETPAQVESLIAKMDVVLTTRLHGMVLALKSGVPCIVIDPIAGGAKVLRQAAALPWPYAFAIEALRSGVLQQAWAACMEPAAREFAMTTATAARYVLAGMEREFIHSLTLQRKGS